ncbi:MAG: GNAT family N-acetyltransferase, partial [Lachnospiraceae bacterium]|nr:GNAT family N-acetyltransferase [Lachnospiraceae bacterium]
MECVIRKWRITDAKNLAELLNNKNILDNLRDGLPYPYTTKDAEDYIQAMVSADQDKTFGFAVTIDDTRVGSIGVLR